jgi:ABC-type protease/lipase transport system fused ATPase/permease subunit
VYLLVIFMFSPWLGLMALVGAVLLTVLAWVNERLTKAPFAEAGELSQQAGLEASANLRNAEVIEAMGMLGAVRQRWARLHHGFWPGRTWQRAHRGGQRGVQDRAPGLCSRWCWGWAPGWRSSS